MKLRKFVVGFIALMAGFISAVIIYELLLYAFTPIEAWYFHKFVEQADPDPALPPLMWVYVLILPLIAAIIGGIITRYIYKQKNFYSL